MTFLQSNFLEPHNSNRCFLGQAEGGGLNGFPLYPPRWRKPNQQRWYAKFGSSVEIHARCMLHVLARLTPICTLSWGLLTKFLHRSSVGSLLRVRCWLGREDSDQSRLVSSQVVVAAARGGGGEQKIMSIMWMMMG